MQRPLKLILLAGLALVLIYIAKDAFFNDDNYIQPLLKEREEKDLSFRSRANTPFDDEGRRAFKNLVYYEPDLAYRVKARVEKLAQQDTLLMPLTNGSYEPYLRYGVAAFELQDKPYKLTLYKKLSEEKTSSLCRSPTRPTALRRMAAGGSWMCPSRRGTKR